MAWTRFTQDSYWFPWTLPLPPVKWISQAYTFFQAYASTQPLSPMAETPVMHLRLARQRHTFEYIIHQLDDFVKDFLNFFWQIHLRYWSRGLPRKYMCMTSHICLPCFSGSPCPDNYIVAYISYDFKFFTIHLPLGEVGDFLLFLC